MLDKTSSDGATQSERDPMILSLVWRRLQFISCRRSQAIGPQYSMNYLGSRHRQIDVPEEIVDNVKILGRADVSEIKGRLLWYLTYHPELFAQALSMVTYQAPADRVELGK